MVLITQVRNGAGQGSTVPQLTSRYTTRSRIMELQLSNDCPPILLSPLPFQSSLTFCSHGFFFRSIKGVGVDCLYSPYQLFLLSCFLLVAFLKITVTAGDHCRNLEQKTYDQPRLTERNIFFFFFFSNHFR